MKRTLALLLCGSMALLQSCGGEDNPKSTNSVAKSNQLDTSKLKEQIGEEMYERTRSMFYSMPSPIELQSMIESAGGYFRDDLVHDPQLASQYQTTGSQAMALGVYGTNLSYSAVFEQQQEALLFMAAAQRVAKKMGINDPFSGAIIERANTNISNKDSMLLIVSEIYWEMNSQLQEENRNQLGLLVLASGWIEGIYLGSQILDIENPEKNMADVLVEQRIVATQLNEMFTDYRSDALIASSEVIFRPLIDLYMTLKTNDEPSTLTEKNGKTIIAGKKKVEYTTTDLKNIRETAASARAKLIGQ
ncbi:MAG: hypothetical protein WEC59_04515 [Salibacteraceae bacterium]